MKKLIIILGMIILSIQGYSCSFATKPDLLISKIVKNIQKEKIEEDVYCDFDDQKMVYYFVEDGNYNLNIGILLKITDSTTNYEFKKNFYEKLSKYATLLNNTIKDSLENKELKDLPLPDKEVIRLIGQFDIENDKNKGYFVIGKYECTREENSCKLIINSKGKTFYENIGLFQGTQVEYSDDMIF